MLRQSFRCSGSPNECMDVSSQPAKMRSMHAHACLRPTPAELQLKHDTKCDTDSHVNEA